MWAKGIGAILWSIVAVSDARVSLRDFVEDSSCKMLLKSKTLSPEDDLLHYMIEII